MQLEAIRVGRAFPVEAVGAAQDVSIGLQVPYVDAPSSGDLGGGLRQRPRPFWVSRLKLVRLVSDALERRALTGHRVAAIPHQADGAVAAQALPYEKHTAYCRKRHDGERHH